MKRIGSGLLAMALAVGLLALTPSGVRAEPLSTQPFTAYGTGAAVSVNALQLSATQTANVQTAFSGVSVNSTGLGAAINNQFGQVVQTAQPAGKNSYGHGSGAEVGLLTPSPQATDVNAIILAQRVEAAAPPNTPLLSNDIPINIPGILSTSTARGQAQATWDPNFCPVGRPLAFGSGYVENAQVVPGASPVVGTSATGNSVSQTRTVSYLAPNGDGTFGVVTEVRSIIAPISVAGTGVTIDVVGELIVRATATGKPGDPRNGITYPGTPVLSVNFNGVPVLPPISLQSLLGQNGLTLAVPPAPLPPLVELRLGAPPTGITGVGVPAVAADGTATSGAVDAVRVKLLAIPGVLTALDLAVGHAEVSATAPPGGVKCNLPVSKVASSDPVAIGSDFTYTISIPSDPGLFAALYSCDLIGIRAVDTVSVLSGRPRFQILGADRGGVVSGNTVTFDNLGNYALGDPPILLNIRMRIPAGSPAGVIRDTLDVSATLGNCRGRAAGDDIVLGSARIDGSSVTGRLVVDTQVGNTAVLAATGGSSAPLVAGGALVLMALGLLRLRRSTARHSA